MILLVYTAVIWASFASQTVLGKPGDLVLLKEGVSKGAVCLDGTPPGYYIRQGIGSSANKLIVYMQGGGWCFDEDECVGRSKSNLGSSKNWPPSMTFSGFLSDDQNLNPHFYDWTVVYLKYCDGASFTGNVDKVVNWKGTDLYFRGFRILSLAIESIKSIRNFTGVILTGGSAGGIATYIHADYVGGLFQGAKYSAFADAGFFINAKNIKGEDHILTIGEYAMKMQNSIGGLDKSCVNDPNKTVLEEKLMCSFPQYSEPFIQSRLFGLNSQYDTWQLTNILQLPCRPPNCNEEEMKFFLNFGEEFRKATAQFVARPGRGYFLDSCVVHTQSTDQHKWADFMINQQSANETFADWYFGTGDGREVDCAYPCNKSC